MKDNKQVKKQELFEFLSLVIFFSFFFPVTVNFLKFLSNPPRTLPEIIMMIVCFVLMMAMITAFLVKIKK